MRRAEEVYHDILSLIEDYGIRRIKFVDESLPVPLMTGLSERILKDAVQVEWEAYTRLEPAWLDPAFVNVMSEAGFRKGYFGLEIVPSSGRHALDKGDSPDPLLLLRNCRDAGVKVHFFCMFGFPGTGRAEAEATVRFLLENQDLIDTVDVFPWTLAKHTSVGGAEPVTDPTHDWALDFRHRPTSPGVLGPDEIWELAAGYEEMLWEQVPRLLHPTYRLVGPWTPEG